MNLFSQPIRYYCKYGILPIIFYGILLIAINYSFYSFAQDFPSQKSPTTSGSSVNLLKEKILINAEGFVYNNFSRIIFHASREATAISTASKIRSFKATLLGNNLKIIFNKPIQIEFTGLLTVLKDHITQATLDDESKIITFTLTSKAKKVRKFIGDDFFGLDIVASKNVRKIITAQPDISNKAQKNIILKESITPQIISNILKSNALLNKEDAIKESIKIEHKSNIKLKIDPLLKSSSLSKSDKHYNLAFHNYPKAPIKLKKNNTDNQEKQTLQEIIKLKHVEKIKKKKPKKTILNVDRERIENGIKLIFPLKKDTGAVIFSRGRYIWIIFDKKYKLDISKIKGIKYIESLQQLSYNQNNIILRIKISNDYHLEAKIKGELLNIRAYKEGYKWILEIQKNTSQSKEILANPIGITSNRINGRTSVFLSVKTTTITNIVKIIDPEIKDELFLIPLLQEETGIFSERLYIDFGLLKTAQGIAFHKISDSLEYQVKNTGIIITSRRKLHISPELFAQKISDNQEDNERKKRERKTVLASETIFPFKKKKGNFIELRRLLNEKIITAPEGEKTKKRLELAKFYFSEEVFSEAIGMLREIQLHDPLFNNMQEVDLMIAASHYMLTHFREAEKAFFSLATEAIDHQSYDEIKFWHWASLYQRDKKERRKNTAIIPVDYIASYDKFMQGYPKELRYSFGLLVIEDKLAKGDIESGRTILEIISYDKIPPSQLNSTKFLQGKFFEISGDLKEAEAIWEELSKDLEDSYNRARSLFALTKLRLIHGDIDVNKAVNIFNQIGIIWRGDNLEIDLLKLVGQLYIKEGKYRKGLRVWKILVDNFPETREAIFISGRMKRTFIELFDGGEAYNMSPMEALALYFEFRNLTPIGELGDKIIQQLSEHFIKADLLENAAALITHQVKFRVTGRKRNILALKLADIHLKNRKPRKVFEALEFIKPEFTPIDFYKYGPAKKAELSYGPPMYLPPMHGPIWYETSYHLYKIPENITKMIKYLEVRAYIKLKRYNKAILVLGDDNSKEAENLLLQIFWQKKNWKKIIELTEKHLVTLREANKELLTEVEAESIMRLAIAYGIEKKREKLQQLQKEFKEKIPTDKISNVFSFVTNNIQSIDHKKFKETIYLDEIQSFVNEYAFWPGKDWKNVISVLAPRMKYLKRNEPPLSKEEKRDIIRLGISYAMILNNGTNKEMINIAKSGLSELNRDFSKITIDKETIQLFKILDDKFIPKIEDEEFNVEIKLRNFTSFVEKYIAARSISELNIAVK